MTHIHAHINLGNKHTVFDFCDKNGFDLRVPLILRRITSRDCLINPKKFRSNLTNRIFESQSVIMIGNYLNQFKFAPIGFDLCLPNAIV